MPKISERPLTRVHLRLFRDTWNELQAMYGNGATAAARVVLDTYVKSQRDKARKGIDQLPVLELSDDELESALEGN